MRLLKKKLFSIMILGCLFAISFYFYPQLPDSIATKFDFNGNPTQYSSKTFVTVFMPAIYLVLILFINVMVKASPKKFSMPNSKNAMDMIVAGCGLLFLGIHFGMVADPGGKEVFVRSFSFGIALFLIVVGNVFGKTERNFFMGVRVPWTIASEANWRATHRFCGKMMVSFGLLLFVLSFVYSSMPVAIVAVLLPTLSPVIYSYLYYQKNEIQVGSKTGIE